jgi:probable rRNA maturation factor
MHSAISYNAENISFSFKNRLTITSWIKKIIILQKKKAGAISFIFCDDAFLLEMNKKYLKRNTYTDIIAFDYCEKENISGDLLISVDRVRENAKKFKKPFNDELCRVICHGILHLTGYSDKKKSERLDMSAKEDEYLLLLKEMKKRST